MECLRLESDKALPSLGSASRVPSIKWSITQGLWDSMAIGADLVRQSFGFYDDNLLQYWGFGSSSQK